MFYPRRHRWHFVYLAVHPAQSTLLNDEVTRGLQEVGAEVALLDVIILIAAVSRPRPGPDTERETRSVCRLKPAAGFVFSIFAVELQHTVNFVNFSRKYQHFLL